MKKTIICLSAILAVLTACDPVESSKDWVPNEVDASTLSECISFTQKDANGQIATDGNYISYVTSPATTLCIYNYKSDGSENILATGATGSFTLAPSRGSNPDQVVYLRVVNSDNTITKAEKTLHVYVQEELSEEVRLLCGNNSAPTSKTWTWDVESDVNAVWGNFGANGSWRGTSISDFYWWGVADASLLLDQLKHSNTGIATGEEDNNAYMTFCEDGSIKTYDAAGNVIRSGSFEVTSWHPEEYTWEKGILHTTEGSILFPFEINSGGRMPTDFQIFDMTEDKLVLVYPDNGAFNDWSEGTYWCFESKQSQIAPSTEGSSKSWTWNTEDPDMAEVWGNFGSDGGARGSSIANFKWWGVTDAADLLGQLNHSNTGVATGEEDNNAYMTFFGDGTIKTYDASGNVIRSGQYEVDLTTADAWQLGTLKTTEGSILFPFEINSGGRMPTEFQIYDFTADKLILTYPDNGAFDGWSEGTYWNFMKKK